MKQLAKKLPLVCLILAGVSGVALAQPTITNAPYNTIGFVNSNVMFTMGASDAYTMTYQWQAGPVGSGQYTNLIAGGQFSAVTNNFLVITNVQVANQADYVCIVTASDGVITNDGVNGDPPPATLTVLPLIYLNMCQSSGTSQNTDEPVSMDNWLDDLTCALLGDIRLLPQTVDGANTMDLPAATLAPWFGCYKSWDGTEEAFYTTCALANGYNTNGLSVMPLVAIPIVTAGTNLTFVVDLGAIDNYYPANASDYLLVQVNGGTNWYASAAAFPTPPNMTDDGRDFQQFAMVFDPAAANWQQVSISGYGSIDNTNYPGPYPLLGPPAPADLSGYITGFGVLCVGSGNQYAHYFANFAVAGSLTYPTTPGINAAPANTTVNGGQTASFTVNATTNNTIAGLTYQWYAQAGGSGSFSALSNSGQYSGVTTYNLNVANCTLVNSNENFVVVVTDGAGSTTSSPPAVLTVLSSAPVLVNDTSDNPPVTGSYVGSAPVTFSVTFSGNLPIGYNWQFTTDTNTGPTNIAGATNTSYVLSMLSTNQSGYYRLQATNTIAPYVAYSSWMQFSVLPASQRLILWQAPVSMGTQGQPATYLTCEQILDNQQGVFFEAAEVPSGPNNSGNGGENVTTKNGNTYFFDNTGTAATLSGGWGNFDTYWWWAGAYLGALPYGIVDPSGNTAFDEVMCSFQYDGYTHTWAINNLTPGVEYSVQLFGLDTRTDSAEYLRSSDYQAVGDDNDVSAAFTMGNVCYVIGTFIATNSTMSVQQNFWTYGGAGNSQAVVVRQLPPSLTISPSGVITWTYGGLFQAPSLSGPWTTNTAISPYQAPLTGQQMFYRAVFYP